MSNDEIVKKVHEIVDTKFSQGAGEPYIELIALLSQYAYTGKRTKGSDPEISK